LMDKYYQVYDGATLIEAVRLGYVITKIHQYMTWTMLSNPLRTFMLHAFEQKNKCKKDTPEYLVHKDLSNGLTGKFSQALIEGDWGIYYDDRVLKEMKSLDRLLNFEWIMNDEDEVVAMAAEVLNPDHAPNKPNVIGVGILATSRVVMSQYTDFIGGYEDPECAIYYGDTDSIIIRSSAYRAALEKDEDGKIFGKGLGMLKDEFGGQGKVIEAIFLAPKTYILEVLFRNGKRKWIIRAKGVPQHKKKVNVKKYYETMNFDVPDDTIADLHTLQFTLIDDRNQIVSTRHVLNMDYFKHMLFDDYKVICTFGSIRRRLHGPQSGNLAAQVTLMLEMERTINKINWWETGKRSKPQSCQGITYPRGT
jgi:DNA polymerase family B